VDSGKERIIAAGVIMIMFQMVLSLELHLTWDTGVNTLTVLDLTSTLIFHSQMSHPQCDSLLVFTCVR
jgi:hypothetical protein